MPNEEGRRTDDTRMVIKALAWYLYRGYRLEVHGLRCAGSPRVIVGRGDWNTYLARLRD